MSQTPPERVAGLFAPPAPPYTKIWYENDMVSWHPVYTAKSNFLNFIKIGYYRFLHEISKKWKIFWNLMSKFCNIRSVRLFWNLRNYFLVCMRGRRTVQKRVSPTTNMNLTILRTKKIILNGYFQNFYIFFFF